MLHSLFLFREKRKRDLLFFVCVFVAFFFGLDQKQLNSLCVIFMFIKVNKWESVFCWVNKHRFSCIVSILNQTEVVELNHQNFLLKFHLSKSIGLSLEPIACNILKLLSTPEGSGFFFSVMSSDMYEYACVFFYYYYEQYISFLMNVTELSSHWCW